MCEKTLSQLCACVSVHCHLHPARHLSRSVLTFGEVKEADRGTF